MANVLNQNTHIFSGKTIGETIPRVIEPWVWENLINVVEKGTPFKGDFSYEYKNERRWYNFIAVKLADGFTVTIRDITERKKYELEMNRLAEVDGLTGIYNRRYFDTKIANEWQRCQRERQFLSLILCDVDYFKVYNDRYGHQAGDECLKKIAKVLEKMMKRTGDLASRYGGEEFAFILPNTEEMRAVEIGEKIRNEIQNLKLAHDKSPVSDLVTLSLGISSVIPTHSLTFSGLIEQADKALYQAKNKGRNQCVFFEKEMFDVF